MIKKMIHHRVTVAILAFILAGVVLFVVQPFLASRINEQKEVIRVKRRIERGHEITTENLERVSVGAHNLPTGVIESEEEILGRYAASVIYAGDFITPEKLSTQFLGKEEYLSGFTEGEGAISIPLKELATGLSGKLQENDIVRLIAVGEEIYDVKTLQYVKVLAVTDESGNDKGRREKEEKEEKDYKTITLLASERQAKDLAYYKENATIYFMLMYRGEKREQEKLLEMQRQILNEIAAEEEIKKQAEISLPENGIFYPAEKIE